MAFLILFILENLSSVLFESSGRIFKCSLRVLKSYNTVCNPAGWKKSRDPLKVGNGTRGARYDNQSRSSSESFVFFGTPVSGSQPIIS